MQYRPLRFLSPLLLVSAHFGGAQPQAASAKDGTAAPQANGTQTLRVTTRIVVLDVVVTDAKGNLVDRTLSKDDFTIIENQQQRPIRSFEPPSEHIIPQTDKAIVNSATDLNKIGDSPVTILVLDELNSRFEDMSFSRQMLLKYLEEQPSVLRQPTVLLAAENKSFQQLHDYTQDRNELIAIVKKHAPEFPWRVENGGNGPAAVERIAQVLSALQEIAQASTGTLGRKNLIWVGNGFPNVNLQNSSVKDQEILMAAMKRCTSQLLAARVTMYSINPAPGSSSVLDIESPDDLDTSVGDNGLNADPLNSGIFSFNNLAPSTGGIAYMGRNDLNNVIADGIAKGQDYYTLSFTPGENENPEKYRKVSVLLRDKDLRAITRSGYYPDVASDLNPIAATNLTPKQVAANLKLDLSNALTSTISYNGLTIKANKSKASKYDIQVAENGIGWSMPAPDGAQHAEATVAAAWYDAKNKLLGHVANEETFVRGNETGATYSLPVIVPHDAVRLRFVIRDAFNGRMGTVDIRP